MKQSLVCVQFFFESCCPSGRLVLVLGVLVGDLGLRYLFLKYFSSFFSVVLVVVVGSNCTVVVVVVVVRVCSYFVSSVRVGR